MSAPGKSEPAPELLLWEADDMLYTSKDNGRNQASFSIFHAIDGNSEKSGRTCNRTGKSGKTACPSFPRIVFLCPGIHEHHPVQALVDFVNLVHQQKQVTINTFAADQQLPAATIELLPEYGRANTGKQNRPNLVGNVFILEKGGVP